MPAQAVVLDFPSLRQRKSRMAARSLSSGLIRTAAMSGINGRWVIVFVERYDTGRGRPDARTQVGMGRTRPKRCRLPGAGSPKSSGGPRTGACTARDDDLQRRIRSAVCDPVERASRGFRPVETCIHDLFTTLKRFERQENRPITSDSRLKTIHKILI